MELPHKVTKAELEALRALPPDEVEDALKALIENKQATKKAKQREYRERNKAKLRAYDNAYRKKNKKKVNAYKRSVYDAEEAAARKKKRREEGAVQAAENAWARRNTDKINAKARRKYARKKAAALFDSDPQAVRTIIRKQLPGYLDHAAREDILSEVCAAIIARKVEFADLGTCAKPYVTAYNRMFDQFKNLSLDAPIPGSEKGETWVSKLVDERTIEGY